MKLLLSKRISFSGLCLLLFTARAVAEDKTYVLAGKTPPPGLVAVETKVAEMKDLSVVLSLGTLKAKSSMDTTMTDVTTTTFVGPDKFTREQTRTESKGSETADGETHQIPLKPGPLERVPIVYQRKDGKWTPSLADGSRPSEDQSKLLDASRPFEADMAFYGTAGHKVGDKWEVKASKLPSVEGLAYATGFVKCELVEVKEVQGLSAAVVKMTFDLSGPAANSGPGGFGDMQIHVTGEATTTRSIDYSLDLESIWKSTMEIEDSSSSGISVKGPLVITRSVIVKKP